MASGTTGMDGNYLRSKFVPKADFSYGGRTVSAPDFLDTGYQASMQSLVPGADVPKFGNTPLTTILYNSQSFGNTSAYWCVLAINGFIGWICLKEGIGVTVPDISPLRTSSEYTSHSLSNPSPTLSTFSF